MQAVASVIMAFFNTVRSWVALAIPIFTQAADFRSWPAWLRLVIRLVVLGGILAGLWFIGDKVGVDQFLPDLPKAWRPFFLPVMFLFLYVLCWLLYWLIITLTEDDTVVEFPDIEDAWHRGVKQLSDEGIQLSDFPLFLILGKTVAGDEALFQASGMKEIIIAPGRERTPVRLFAHRDAIYVVCSGATSWGRYCSMLAGDQASFNTAETIAKRDLSATLNPDTAATQSGMEPELFKEMNDLLSLRTERALTPEEQARLQELSDLSKAPKQAVSRREAIPKSVLQTDQARLMYLCKLINRDRRPWCPLNGIFVLIPWQSLESDSTNKEGYVILSQELGLIRETTNLRAPIITMVCDLETAIGFTEFRNCFPSEVLKQRVGQRIPLSPELPVMEIPKLYDQAAHWIGQTVLPKWVLQFLRMDQSADLRKTPGVAIPYNANLYLLLREMYLRSPRLGRLLSRSFAVTETNDTDTLPLFGGCYLAATGKTEKETAFVSGVFSRLTENQNAVSWLPEAFQDERSYGWWTIVGYITAFLLFAGTIALMLFSFQGKG